MAAAMVEIVLIDGDTNLQYTVLISPEDAEKARADIEFATRLLNNEKKVQAAKARSRLQQQQPQQQQLQQQQPQQQDCNIPVQNNDEAQHIWSNSETLLLLDLYHQEESSFTSGKMTQKNCWIAISKKMEDNGYKISGHKCATKFQALKRTYKNVLAHNAKSGNDRKEWEYFDKMNEMFSNKPWVKPLAVAGSSMPANTEEQLPDKNKPSTRKAKVDAAILRYMDNAVEDRRLRREAQDTRHREKMSVLHELRDIMNRLDS